MRVLGIAAAVAAIAAPAAAASWSAPQRLGREGSFDAATPRAAVDAQGHAVVAYVGVKGDVWVASGSRSRGFGRPGRLAARGVLPAVAVAPGGRAVVVWSARGRLWLARRPSAGRRFGHPRDIAAARPYAFSQVALSADGTIAVAWEQGTGIAVTVVTPAGDVQPPLAIPAARLWRGGEIAIDATGRAAVAVMRSSGPNAGAGQQIAVAVREPGGSFTAPQLVSSIPAYDPAIDALAGRLAVTWVSASGPESRPYGAIQLSTATSAGPWSMALDAPFVSPGRSFDPDAVLEPDGSVIVTWQEKDAPQPFSDLAPVRAAIAGPTGGFGPRQTIVAAKVAEPQTVRLAGGRVLVVYRAGTRLGAVAFDPGSGRWGKAPAPAGAVDGATSFFANRDLAATGRNALATWTRTSAGRVGRNPHLAVYASIGRL